MASCRIIPCLDVKDGRLVKGVRFVSLREIGEPAEAARAYSEAGADELVFLDISATLEGRRTMLEVVSRTVEACSVPVTVGGGVGSTEDAARLFEAGAQKVSVNTAAVSEPDLIERLAHAFGSDRVVVAIDASRNEECGSGYEVLTRGGTRGAGLDVVEWGREAEERGAGELLPTSLDRDGTRDGYDIPLTRALSDAVGIPVIASGGAGSLEHLHEAVTDGGADACLVASLFHLGLYTIAQAKEFLRERGIEVRL